MSGQDDFFLRHTAQDRLIDYWWDVDANDARRAGDFYTADCIYQMLEHRMDGPAEVDAYYAYRRGRGERLVRHVLTNLQSRVVTARAGFISSARAFLNSAWPMASTRVMIQRASLMSRLRSHRSMSENC